MSHPYTVTQTVQETREWRAPNQKCWTTTMMHGIRREPSNTADPLPVSMCRSTSSLRTKSNVGAFSITEKARTMLCTLLPCSFAAFIVLSRTLKNPRRSHLYRKLGRRIVHPHEQESRTTIDQTNRTLPFSKFVFRGLQDQLRGDRNIPGVLCV